MRRELKALQDWRRGAEALEKAASQTTVVRAHQSNSPPEQPWDSTHQPASMTATSQVTRFTMTPKSI